MLSILALAAAVAGTPQSAPAAPSTAVAVQATASARIVSGVRLKLDGSSNAGLPPARDAIVTTKDGTRQPARLIEFE